MPQKLNQTSVHQLMNLRHEIRGALSAIRGFADNLGDELLGPLNEKQTEACKTIAMRASILAQLLANLKDLEELEKESLEMELETVDLKQLIKKAIDDVEVDAEEFRISLKADLPENLPAVQGDKVWLMKLVRSLMDNGIKYSPEGWEIQIAAEGKGEHLELSVRDEGKGIEPKLQDEVFDKFKTFEVGLHGEKGFGLGLTLVKLIVDKHKGKVELQSTPGYGTCVKVILPAVS